MCEISIVIPVYNKKRYIVDSVKSVLSQTFRDFELLLIDDGSTDGSGAICDRLSVLDERVKVYHIENRGVSAARNYGIRKASGKYIGFIDADDNINKTFLEKLYYVIQKNDAELAVSGYYEVNNGRRIIHNIKNYNSGNEVFEYLRNDILCILWNKLFVREKIRHLFDERISTCEDSIFVTQYYLDNRPKIAVVNEALYRYSVHNSGLTATFQKTSFNGIRKLLRLNRLVSEQITDNALKSRIIHHLYKVYNYGIYTYIFGNLYRNPITQDKLSIVDQVINDRAYQRKVRYILLYPFRDRRAERIGVFEFLIMISSLCKMKRMVLFLSKMKNHLDLLIHH